MKTQLLALRGASPVQRSNQGYPRRGSVNNPNFPLALLGLGSPCALASHSRSPVWGARAHSPPTLAPGAGPSPVRRALRALPGASFTATFVALARCQVLITHVDHRLPTPARRWSAPTRAPADPLLISSRLEIACRSCRAELGARRSVCLVPAHAVRPATRRPDSSTRRVRRYFRSSHREWFTTPALGTGGFARSLLPPPKPMRPRDGDPLSADR